MSCKVVITSIVCLFLTACGTTKTVEPEIRTVEVKVSVPVACVPANLGPAPAYPDTDDALRALPGAAERYVSIAAGRLLRDARLAELEPVVRLCAKTPN